MTTSRARVVYSTSMACRLFARSDEMHDISETQNSWQSIARRHLHGARLKLKCLALSMSKEMPGILLEYLSPSAPPLLSSLNKQVQASTSCLETQTDTSANTDTEPDAGSDNGNYAQLASHDSEAHLQDSDACSQDSDALSADWHTWSVTSGEVSEMLAKATARVTDRERAIFSTNFPYATTQLGKNLEGLDQAESEYELLQARLKPSLDTIANLQSDRHARRNSTGPLSTRQVTEVAETDSSDSDGSSCCHYSSRQAICKARPQSTADIRKAALAAPAATQYNPFTAIHAGSKAGSGHVQADCVHSSTALQAAKTAQCKSASQAATASGNAVAAAAAALVAARAASERASAATFPAVKPAVAAAAAPTEPISSAASAAKPAAAAASARRPQKLLSQTASPAAVLAAKRTSLWAEPRAQAVPITEATDSEAEAGGSASSSAAILVVMKNSLAVLSKCVLKAKSQLPRQTKAKRLANVAAKEKVFSDASAVYGRAVRSEPPVYVRAAAKEMEGFVKAMREAG